MNRFSIRGIIAALALLACAAPGVFAQYNFYPGAIPNAGSLLKDKKVLLVSINSSSHVGRQTSAVRMWDSISNRVGFQMTKTTTPNSFTDANLAQFDILIINYVTTIGTFVPNAAHRAAVMKFLRDGGNFIVYHISLDVKGTWVSYADSVCGMDFLQYNTNQNGTLTRTVAADHPATTSLPASLSYKDEWYPMTPNPSLDPATTVLYTVNEATLPSGPGQYPMNATSQWGPNHPVAWVRNLAGGGRAYCAIFVHDDNETTTPWINHNFFTTSMLRAAEYVAGYQGVSIALNGAGLHNQKTPMYLTGGDLRVDATEPYRLEVRSLQGTLLFKARGNSGENLHRPGALRRPGMYIVRVASKAGNYNQRVLVR